MLLQTHNSTEKLVHINPEYLLTENQAVIKTAHHDMRKISVFGMIFSLLAGGRNKFLVSGNIL